MSEIGFTGFFTARVVDGKIPAGVHVLDGGEHSLIAAIDYEGTLDRLMADPVSAPLVAEDLASLAESVPFLIRAGGKEGPVRCESCGTPVVAVPESPAGGERRWSRAIWEDGTYRKHTLRRCQWRREQAAGASPQVV